MNIANKLTMLRIIMIPFFIVAFFYEKRLDVKMLSCIIFSLAAFTDFLDGYLARKYNLITTLGKFMDPLADKILVVSAMICLVQIGKIEGFVVILIISREYSISILRAIASSEGKVIAASKGGKVKTVTQLVSLILLLLNAPYAIILFYISAIITIYSGVEYIYLNKELFK